MLYFAELCGKTVKSSDGSVVGVLHDFAFLGSDQPIVTKLTIKNGKDRIVVPISSMKTINGTITLSSGYQTTTHTENELSIRLHLLDQQIIDIKGNKVVRVNDVAIQEKPYLVIAGVDVGVLGIARWLKLEQLLNKNMALFGKTITSNFLPWDDIQPLELSRGKVILRREETKLTRLPPEDLADHLERLSIKNLTQVLDLLPTEFEAEVIQNLNVSRQRALFRTLKPDKSARILSRIDPDEAVDILLTLSPARRESIRLLIAEEPKKPIDYLLTLAKTDIGALATNEFVSCNSEDTTYNVKKLLKTTAAYENVSYVYVLNKRHELVGVFNLHELLLQENDAPVYKFMVPNVVVVHLTTPPEIAIKKMIKYKIYALPIINDKMTMLGVVTIDDLLESVQERIT
jgi:magnesium transporter